MFKGVSHLLINYFKSIILPNGSLSHRGLIYRKNSIYPHNDQTKKDKNRLALVSLFLSIQFITNIRSCALSKTNYSSYLSHHL